MPHNELRKDYLLDRWVVIAVERARRPTDFVKKEKTTVKADLCPLCPGNEHMTPPAILIYKEANGRIEKTKDEDGIRYSDWTVRCIPNLYPAFTPPTTKEKMGEKIFKRRNYALALGHHEVLVESPNHDEHPSEARISQLVHVINAYIDRLKWFSTKPYVRYVSIFRNHGYEAGASLSHAHGQIIATPMIPRLVKDELKASMKYWKQKGECVFCQIINEERQGPRVIAENSDYVAFAPYASVHPMEFWLMPKRHRSSMLLLTEAEIENFAKILKTCLSGLKILLNDPPYNYGFHMDIREKSTQHYHWHLEVYPKLAVWAGFEKNTGMYINTVQPEKAAESLREAIQNLKA